MFKVGDGLRLCADHSHSAILGHPHSVCSGGVRVVAQNRKELEPAREDALTSTKTKSRLSRIYPRTVWTSYGIY